MKTDSERVKGWLAFLCVTVLLIPVVVGFVMSNDPTNSAQCAEPGTIMMSNTLPTSTRLPSLPNLGMKFQTVLSGNLNEFSTTSKTAMEYFDGYNKLAAVVTYGPKPNTKTHVILDYNNNQAITVKINPGGGGPTTCTVSDLASTYMRTFFEDNPSQKNKPYISHTTEALHLAQSNGLMYLGKSIVDGVNTDHWQSCIRYDDGNLNYTSDMYFTDEGWTTTYGTKQVPVKFHITGYTMNDTYVYSNFKMLGYDDNFDIPYPFQVPDNVLCTGLERSVTKKIPSFSDSYAYKWDEEIVRQIKHSSTLEQTGKVWYDQTHNLLRNDYEAFSNFPRPPYNSNNSVMEISDFSQGLTYCIDKVFGNCSVIPLRESFAVSDIPKKRLKTMAEYFLINSTYQYVGKQTVRTLVSDVFVSLNTKYLNGANTSTNRDCVITHYFSSAQSMVSDNLTSKVPVKLVVYYNDSQLHHAYTWRYNFYNFKGYEPVYQEEFDITRCFDDHSKVSLKVLFKGISLCNHCYGVHWLHNQLVNSADSDETAPAEAVSTWSSLFTGVDTQKLQSIRLRALTDIVEYVAIVNQISYIRVQKADLYFDNNDAIFTCIIVDAHQSSKNSNSEPETSSVVKTLQEMVLSRQFQLSVGNMQLVASSFVL